MHKISTIHEVDAGEFVVRSVLLQGRRFSLIWDTLTHPRDMATFAAACVRNRCFVVYSHADWDHVQGTSALDNPLVIGHRECHLRFQNEVQETLARMQAQSPGTWDAIALVPPVITFDRHLDVDLGEMTVSLHSLPGHSADSIVAFVPNLKLLLAGDTVELPCPSVPSGCNLDKWIRSLERWREHKGVRTIITSHGPCGGKELFDQTIRYLEGLRSGKPQDLPADATAFYQETHRNNLRHCDQC